MNDVGGATTGAHPGPEARAPEIGSERSARLWTPERVPLTVPLAGLGERSLAYVIDLAVLIVVVMAGLLLYNVWGDLLKDVGGLSTLGTVLLGVALVAGAVLLDVLCEVLFAGRTLGKRMMKLRVLHASGRTPDLFVALLRNALRLIDMLPFGYAVGTVAIFVTGTRRLGDLVADTFVVTERSRARDPLALCHLAVDARTEELPRARRPWSDATALQALSFIERTSDVDAKIGDALCARALRTLDPSVSPGPHPRATLAALCLALADDKSGALAQLARLADAERALAAALGSLVEGCAPAVVDTVDAAIRRASSELMRGARRELPARHLESLSLALLDAERRRVVREPVRRAFAQYFLSEVPKTVWAERGLVARAGAILAIGLCVGGSVAYADASVARFLIGDEVSRLVEHGATWTDAIEKNGEFAQASAQIIVNNVGVGLRVFALGMLGGVATILGLLSNGVQIGATFGYALRLGTADTLLRFICAHGPVELTMIAVAGAAGMCLGRALIAPGRRSRVQALREEGARGIRLVTAATVGFMCIGTVEGFISPGRMFPTPVNLTIGLTLLAIFWGWVRAFGGAAPPAATTTVQPTPTATTLSPAAS